MAGGHRLHRAADIVGGHQHAVRRGQVGDAAALRQPAGLGDVRGGDVGTVPGQKLTEAVHAVQVLAGANGNGRRGGHLGHRRRVLRRDRVFQPAQIQRRQPLREPQRAARVAASVRVDRQPGVPVEYVMHGAHQVQRRLGARRPRMNAQLQRPHAQALQLLGTRGVGGRRVRNAVVAGHVQRDPLPHPPSEELPDRHACGLTSQVPERHLHPADRTHHGALVEARPGHGHAHVAGQPFHIARVATEQRSGEARVDRNAMDAGPMVRLSQSDQAGIGKYAHQHPGRTAHQHGADPRDPHGPPVA